MYLMFITLFVFFATVFLLAYLTDPFKNRSIVKHQYRSKIEDKKIIIIRDNDKLNVNQSAFLKVFSVLKSGSHIIESRYSKRDYSQKRTVDEIIEDIYRLRFSQHNLLLTSGDHFSSLFVRNLGVFYYPTLDTNLQTNNWADRQSLYLKTLDFALGTFKKTDRLYTTIVPTGQNRVTGVDFHSNPSDTLYGVLYALAAALGEESSRPYEYGFKKYDLYTIDAAKKMLEKHKKSLNYHYKKYKKTVYDENLGLIRKDIRMSGAKDITKRSSAFFDNVIFWKTTQIAMNLGIIEADKDFLTKLKDRIINKFWLEDEGYFLEDLSEEGVKNKYYSSDWMIVLVTKFLDIENKDERKYFIESLKYLQKMKIDKPFGVQYQHETRANRQFFIVRMAVASYGGDSIWSFWGMEYIKILLALYKETKKDKYLKDADYQIKKYEQNIVKYRGFPEVYDKNGKMLQTWLYRSIRMTGWVIGFDQVRAIRKQIK